MLEDIDLRQFSGFFADTEFERLMQNRIYKVLLICSAYDAFLLEEDGRIEEQLFNEYVALNLRYPPQIIHVKTAEKAFEVLEDVKIDLVITMLSVGGMDPFIMAKEVKKKYEDKPIVVLTPFRGKYPCGFRERIPVPSIIFSAGSGMPIYCLQSLSLSRMP